MTDAQQPPVALITAAGTAISPTAAQRLTDTRWTVVIAGRRQPREEVTSRSSRIHLRVAGVVDAKQARGLVDCATSLARELMALVNNAGVVVGGPTGTAATAGFERVFAVSVSASAHPVALASPHLAASRGVKRQYFIALAERRNLGSPAYGASKATLAHLIRRWAVELADRRIHVKAIAPSPADTAILTTVMSLKQAKRIREVEAANLSLGRRWEPGVVARWIHALVDPTSGWATGSGIAVNGGLAIA